MTDVQSGLLTLGTLKLFADKTRDKILAASLVVFNQKGFQNVTTASIADVAGVLEGTLWYHFRAKQDMLDAHISLLQAIFAKENKGADDTDPAAVIDTIFKAYDVIWDFRYLLRDDFEGTLAAEGDVLRRVRMVNDFLDRWTEGRMRHAEQAGLLQFEEGQAQDVSEIILVMGRYWMDFSHKKYPDEKGVMLRHKGLSHIFTVLKPYLSKDAKALIAARLKG